MWMSCVNSGWHWMIRPCCGCNGPGRSGGGVRRFPGVITATLLLALAGCGSNGDEPAASAPGTANDAPATDAAGRNGDDSVAAVLQSQGTPLATLRFTVTERPVAGQAFGLQLAATAAQPGDLMLRVESTDLVATPETAELALEAAQPVTRDFTLTATTAGLAELTVRLSGEAGRPETVYAIPVLVAAAP